MKNKVLLFVLVLTIPLFSFGCSYTKEFGIAGGAVGGIAGLIAGNPVVGLIVGASLGGGLGYYYDRRDERDSAEFRRTLALGYGNDGHYEYIKSRVWIMGPAREEFWIAKHREGDHEVAGHYEYIYHKKGYYKDCEIKRWVINEPRS